MIIELGNHSADTVDGAPAITTIHIPEADEQGLGGYSHKPGGIKSRELKDHLVDSIIGGGGITRLPDHEILVAVLHPIDGVWANHGKEAPAWVNVIPTPDLTPKGVAEDVQKQIEDYFGIKKEKPGNFEDIYHTRFGAPGQGGPNVPDHKALFTNNGRVIANVNDGGGQVGLTGTGTAATATTLTTASTLTTNAWAGYRVYCMQTGTGPLVWGNVLSNTNAAGASVLTVDRWYTAATPGGAAATTPSAGWYFMLADGGSTAAWFVALATGANAPAATDTTLATNGNVEYAVAGGGYIRKIAPYAQTSGVASRALTLTPVYTGNGSDTYPQTFTTIGAFTSMVVGSVGTMKFETALNASATVNVSGDQVTVTETVTGS